MALRHAILAFLIASSVFGISAAYGGRKALASDSDDGGVALAPEDSSTAVPPGADLGFTPLNTKHPKVIELAKFAIDEYNKEHNAKLVFYSVMEAISTAASGAQGTNYGLVVAATDDGSKELSDYVVNVLVDKDNKKITYFKGTE